MWCFKRPLFFLDYCKAHRDACSLAALCITVQLWGRFLFILLSWVAIFYQSPSCLIYRFHFDIYWLMQTRATVEACPVWNWPQSEAAHRCSQLLNSLFFKLSVYSQNTARGHFVRSLSPRRSAGASCSPDDLWWTPTVNREGCVFRDTLPSRGEDGEGFQARASPSFDCFLFL